MLHWYVRKGRHILGWGLSRRLVVFRSQQRNTKSIPPRTSTTPSSSLVIPAGVCTQEGVLQLGQDTRHRRAVDEISDFEITTRRLSTKTSPSPEATRAHVVMARDSRFVDRPTLCGQGRTEVTGTSGLVNPSIEAFKARPSQGPQRYSSDLQLDPNHYSFPRHSHTQTYKHTPPIKPPTNPHTSQDGPHRQQLQQGLGCGRSLRQHYQGCHLHHAIAIRRGHLYPHHRPHSGSGSGPRPRPRQQAWVQKLRPAKARPPQKPP